ncbi:uncharacterized protein LOC129905799 [Episyrphus balteatus]|uniref:uncharacterized protein LOC129905799 n=1 Tax=Episyrphus balteatus TaxID=286459 RepID=UPI00248566FC|nr:uncharacterized protein LOC129905799 [Episyrphus balteatus]
MKFIPLHTKNTEIMYKNSLCSSAAFFVFVLIILSVMIPVLLVSILSPYSGISESRVLYEQPKVMFTFQYLFLGELSGEGAVACSTFAYFNSRTKEWQQYCDSAKFSSQDHNYDSHMDTANFQLHFDDFDENLQSFDLLLFFEATLRHKCQLTPPAALIHHLQLPKTGFSNGIIKMKGYLRLNQNAEFICPFYGRNAKTHFRGDVLPKNTSNMEYYQFEYIQELIRLNPAFFELEIAETYYKPSQDGGVTIQLQMDIVQVPARYHLSVWERCGQFWLYFASFFGISFYIMNKTKDFLFGRHILRSWEVIPWKKIY